MASYVILTPALAHDAGGSEEVAALDEMAAPSSERAGDETVFIRDGFSFLALIFPLVWLLWYRLWWWAAMAVLVTAIAAYADTAQTLAFPAIVASSLFSLFIALEGSAMRVRHLEAAGWRIQAAIEAPDLATAEEIWFADLPPAAHKASNRHSAGMRRDQASFPMGRGQPSGQAAALGLLEWPKSQ